MMSLDDDIAAWAATVRLADAGADAIFQRIVGTPVLHGTVPPSAAPALAPSWWRTYNAGFASRMVASMVRAA
jgi:hypothetical protein